MMWDMDHSVTCLNANFFPKLSAVLIGTLLVLIHFIFLYIFLCNVIEMISEVFVSLHFVKFLYGYLYNFVVTIQTIITMCHILYFVGRMNKCRSKWLII
jgi:uncharacterized BrkB/YihY/UPF0761 family membrane protein